VDERDARAVHRLYDRDVREEVGGAMGVVEPGDVARARSRDAREAKDEGLGAAARAG
jgi:hypothetical protein